MAAFRRLAAVAGFFLLISLPGTVQLSGRARDDGQSENRVLSPPPPLPTSLRDVLALPRTTDAWLDDHFGFRRALIGLSNRLRFAVFGESGNPQIAFGRHRQLFLTSHDAADPQQMLLFLCRGGSHDAGNRTMAMALAGFLEAAIQHDPRMIDLLVPTKTILDRRDLPGWMQARCAGGREVLPALLAALNTARPDLIAHVDYPLALMRRLREAADPYPRFNFHWDGPAVGAIAATVAENRFGRRRLGPLPTISQAKQSDIARLLPGVRLDFHTAEPDLARAGITGGPQIPALGASGRILGDVSSFTRHDGPETAREPRLLIISDSFGQAIAPWFAAYYGQVWHVAINNLQRLGAPERQALLASLFNGFRPDDLLLVFHDYSQGYLNAQLTPLLWRPGSTPRHSP